MLPSGPTTNTNPGPSTTHSTPRVGLRDLPPELLLNIAETGSDAKESLAWLLSCVNQFSRSTMINTSSLWSTINTLAGMRIVNKQLMRAKNCPLDVSMILYSEQEVIAGRDLIDRMAELGRLQNMQKLQFICPSDHKKVLEDTLETLFLSRFSATVLDLGLSHLNTMARTEVPFRRIQLGGLDFPEHTVTPVHLTLRGFLFNETRMISFARLESLVLVDCWMNLGDMALALQDAQGLQHIRFERMGCGGVPDVGVTLPNLRSAEFIRTWAARDFRFICAPMIQHLAYQPHPLGTTWHLDHDDDDPPRSDPRIPMANLKGLRTLQLLDCPMSVHAWRRLLQSLPALEELNLSGCQLTRADLWALFQGDTLACPQLTKLAIEDEFELESSTILEILKARNETGTVKAVKEVAFRKWLSSNLRETDVDALRAAGITCTVDEVFDRPVVDNDDDDEAISMMSASSKDSFFYEHEYSTSDEGMDIE